MCIYEGDIAKGSIGSLVKTLHINDRLITVHNLALNVTINNQARKAISQANMTDKPLLTASINVRVMSYSGGKWIISSPEGVTSSKVH